MFLAMFRGMTSFRTRDCIALLLVLNNALAIPVDNGVEGDPEIECGPTSITINFNTQKSFEGHVYVKGLYGEPGCRNDESGRQVAGITLPFDTCNVARTRSLNPKGIFVTTTVVISFHPNFVTKVDRAYRVQCFYMESDKTVSAEVAVSDLTTAFHSQNVPMPICKYEILNNGPEGEPITFAEIGQQVYHKWTCDSETTDTFCMVVHSCFVDDGNGDVVNIINPEGCALDRYILNNLEYPTDLMAGQEAHVYKYADRAQLFYQCQITVTIKEPHGECPRPQCPEPIGRGAGAGGEPLNAPAGNINPEAAVLAGMQQVADNSRGGDTGLAGPPVPSVPPRKSFVTRQRIQLRRFIREVDWKDSAAGTMDVRTEMSALDILEQGSKYRNLREQEDTLKHRILPTSIHGGIYCIDSDIVALAKTFVCVVLVLIICASVYFVLLREQRKGKQFDH